MKALTFFLYGPPGSGKTALGKALAGSLDLPFCDLDYEIEAAAGKSIASIFEQNGEAGFRALEKQILGEVLSRSTGVVSLGGGTLLDGESRRQVESLGLVLCLQSPAEVLAGRLQASRIPRPLLVSPTASPAGPRDGELTTRLGNLLLRRAEHYASFPLQLDTASPAREELAWQAQIRLGAFRVVGMGSPYRVVVAGDGAENGWQAQLGETFHQLGLNGPAAVVADEHTAPLHGAGVVTALENVGCPARLVVLPAGESHKTLESISRLWQAFLEAGLDRQCTVVAVGGGVVSDLAGFAAATYMRGIPWVVVPTSLLAMVDASLGGKTGADLPEGKNLVGAFHPPRLVLAGLQSLDTLPEAEFRYGMAEVVKAGVIGDPALFELCRGGPETVQENLREIICRAIGVKVRVINADPYEGGLRSSLNLGHTLGHALETASDYRLSHGEAVAIGMAGETRLAERLGLAETGLGDQIEGTLQGLELPVRIPSWLDWEPVLQAMRLDKKRQAGQPRFALPIRVGEVRPRVIVREEALRGLRYP